VATPALGEWFSISIRRNRQSFMISLIALFVTFMVCYLIWLFFAQTENGRAIGLLIFGLPAGLCSYLLIAQRLRDFNMSGWFALLWIVISAFDRPVAMALEIAALVVLCGIPGSTGPNKFGDDPLNSNR
jgi:uncharacterized membrane protein YhaH (DUF805 family)